MSGAWRRVGVSKPVDPSARDPLFWLLVVGLMVRVAVPTDVIGLFYNYEGSGGSPLAKIAPGSYLVFAAAGLAALRPVQPTARWAVPPAIVLAALVLTGVVWGLFTGSLTAIGGLFDLYLIAAAGLFALSRLDNVRRRQVFDISVGFLGINFVVLLIEFVTHHRLITNANSTASGIFRPGGFLGHPLLDGLVYGAAAPLMLRLRRPLYLRVLFSSLAVVAVIISGARFATIVSLAMLPLTVFIAVRREPSRPGIGQWKTWLQLVVMFAAAPLGVVFGLESGLGYRFANGLVDDSSLKRVHDFQLLNYLSPHEWLFGGAADKAQVWSLRLFNGASLESPVVLGTFLFGLPVTLVLLSMVVVSLILLARRGDVFGWLSALALFVISSSNNSLMVKGSSLLFIVAMIGASLATAVERPLVERPMWRASTGAGRWRAPSGARAFRRSSP